MKKLMALFIALFIVASLGSSIALAAEGTYQTPLAIRGDDGCGGGG